MSKKTLGALEGQVMEIVWDLQQATVRDVLKRLGAESRAYTTIMTTMDRLHRKGLLSRERDGNAYTYQPVQDRDAYWHSIAHETMQELLSVGGDATLSAFVDAASTEDEKNLDRLEQLIRLHRGKRES